MKRRRISRVSNSNSKGVRNHNGNANHSQIHYSGPSFSDLSEDIILNILFRLPIKSIFICESVCKTWHDLISDPEFAKLHFDETRDQLYPLIHGCDPKSLYGTVSLAQPNKGDFELKLNMCDPTYSNPGCVCNVKVKLDTKFELPLRDLEMVNSCNGLLCLTHRTHNRVVIICNPITSEFTNLPYGKVLGKDISYGFGFSHVANQYKVVRIIAHERVWDYGTWRKRLTVEINIVGTDSWRDIGSKLQNFIYGRPTYLNGFLYWSNLYDYRTSGSKPLTLISFDIENECFGFSLGPEVDHLYAYETNAMGVLGGELCISVVTESRPFCVWAMKDYGVEKAWSKVFSIDIHSSGGQVFHDALKPMKYLNDGSLLMFDSYSNALVHVDRKKCRFRFLKIRGMESKIKGVVAHNPSLISLKDSLSEYNMNVSNLRLRCEKVHKPAKYHYIVEEEFPSY